MSELQTERAAEEGKVQSSELDALTVRIAQQEGKMSAMNQTLSEIKTLLNGLQLATITHNSSRLKLIMYMHLRVLIFLLA